MAKTGTQVAPVRAFRTLMGSDPIRELFDLQRGINRLFEDTVGGSGSGTATCGDGELLGDGPG